MKNYTEEEIFNEIDKVRKDIRNNWSAWGDASQYRREWADRKLYKIKRMIKAPKRIEFTKVKRLGNYK